VEEELSNPAVPTPGDTNKDPYVRALGWSGIYGLNLFVPLPLGLLVIRDGSGWIGMLFAVALCWATGLVVCTQFPRLYSVLSPGGVLIAFTQFFPVLQIIAGAVAIGTYEDLGGDNVLQTGLQAIGGFVVTLWTAFPLLLAAFVLGGGFRLVLSWFAPVNSNRSGPTLSDPGANDP
jgi:hypothetical protein